MPDLKLRLPQSIEHLSEWIESINLSAIQRLSPGVSRAWVEVAPRRDDVGGIYLGEDASWSMWEDVGVLLSASRIDAKNKQGKVVARALVDVQVGDLVIVRRNSGTAYKSFKFPGYVPRGEIRCYGARGGCLLNSADRGTPVHPEIISPGKNILARFDMQQERWKAVDRNVLIQVDRQKEETKSGILLSEGARQTLPSATVLSAGSLCQLVKEGDRVLFHEGAVEAGQDQCFIEEDMIDAVLL